MSEEHKNNPTSGEYHNLSDITSQRDLKDSSVSKEVSDALKEKQERIKKDVKSFTDSIIKNFKYVKAVGLIPAQATKKIEEEYEILEKDSKKGLTHLLVVIPEKKFKNIAKIRLEIIKLAQKINDKFWIHVMTPVDIWNLGLDSKFEIMEALSMSYPLTDKGFLGALRVTQVHKSLVLRKFEKYVTSYVIGGSIAREEEIKTSDVDVFIVIDDTDVKRMPRLELKEKLRGIIYSYIQEAEAISGVRNKLSPQIFLLTDFWDAVKDAHPVMFTFIRDGIPLYDRGAFLPWKSLLRMGKIKPSPEALDMFMSSGDKMKEIVNKRIFDIAVLDIFYGVFTPTQGLLMLYGQAPKNHRETVKAFREIFVEKEKMIESRYADILDEITLDYFKGYEHNKIKPGEISGADLDRLKRDAIDFIKRLKELRFQIEKRNNEKSIVETYAEVFGMLEAILKKKTEISILKKFNDEMVKSGKFPKRFLDNLKFISNVKAKLEKHKSKASKKEDSKDFENKKDVETARKYAAEIVKVLIEYTQRCDLVSMDRARFVIKGRSSEAEVFFLESAFLVQGPKIRRIKDEDLVDSNPEELKRAMMNHKGKEVKIDFKAFSVLRKIFGEFDLIY